MFQKIVIYVLLARFALLVNALNYNEQCQKQYESGNGTITAKLTKSSGGCAFLCYRNGESMKKPIYLPENAACGQQKVCHQGYCNSPDFIKACQEKMGEKDAIAVDMGCTVICSVGSSTEEVMKPEGHPCKTTSTIGTCDHGLCKGHPISTDGPPVTTTSTPETRTTPTQTTPSSPTTSTTPEPPTFTPATTSTTPEPPTFTPATTEAPSTVTVTPTFISPSYEVDIGGLCRGQYPYIHALSLWAIPHPETSGCQYYCTMQGQQLHQESLYAPSSTPCGGKPGFVCNGGNCHDVRQVDWCLQRARQIQFQEFKVEMVISPCYFICVFRNGYNIRKETISLPDGTPCGANNYGYLPVCRQGNCY